MSYFLLLTKQNAGIDNLTRSEEKTRIQEAENQHFLPILLLFSTIKRIYYR